MRDVAIIALALLLEAAVLLQLGVSAPSPALEAPVEARSAAPAPGAGHAAGPCLEAAGGKC